MKAKLFTAAALTLAGLGAIASQSPPVLPTDSQRSEPGPAEGPQSVRVEEQPVETPLVEKLLPKKPDVPADGQLSPGGQWRWSEADWKWLPVKKAVVKQPGPMWLQDGHGATVDHLVNTHGYSRAELAGLSQRELDVLHSNSHNAARAAAPVRSNGCPGGVCPSPSRGFRLFGRRR